MANIVPVAGIFEVVKLYHANKTKAHKKLLLGLVRECDSLLTTVREYSESSLLVGTDAAIEANEIERSIERISRRGLEWASYDDKTASVRHHEIKIGIDECYRELTACSDRFTMTMAALADIDTRIQEADRRRAFPQLYDSIVGSLENLQTTSDIHGRVRGADRRRDFARLYDLMVRALEELQTTSDNRDRVREAHQKRDFAQLYDLMVRSLEEVQTNSRSMPPAEQQWTELLSPAEAGHDNQTSSQLTTPPRPKPRDLTGKVSIISQQPDIKGSLLDFYLGEWESDEEQATLGCPKDQSPASQMHFKEWVGTCVGLHHRHLLGISGHVTIGDSIYSVSPWMRNGNIREFIRINPNVDRLRLLGEVASALEYLHENEIIHGDICGKNVLINGDGKAFVCGFNLSGYLKPSFDIARTRWFSPERMTPHGFNPPTEKGDVWSFGSLGVEVFTGQDPYSSHKDFYVPVLLNGGTPPADRGSTTVDMSSQIWDLLESCWQTDPTKRPSMSDVHLAIRGMLALRVDRQQRTFPGGDLDSVFTIDSASIHGSDRDWGSVFTMESASIRGSDRDWGSVFAASVHRSSLGTFVSVDN